jgi:hypothetical protein
MSNPGLSPAHPWSLATDRRLPRTGNRRLLRRLAASGGWLEPTAPVKETDAGFRLVAAGKGERDDAPLIGREVVEDWQRRGWLAATPAGTLRPTSLGLAAAGLAQSAEDPISPHRRQHGLIGEAAVSIDGAARRVKVDAAESPLGWLRRRRDGRGRPLIDEAQYAAGERLRADFTIAQLAPRVTTRFDRTIASGARGRAGAGERLTPGERAMEARRRVHRALAAVGPELAGILLEVCCLLSGLEAGERRLGLPQRAGKVVLQIALSRLADHYGLTRPDRPGDSRVRVRSWGAEDYRPALFGFAGEEEAMPPERSPHPT